MADPERHTRAYPFSLSLFTSFSLFWVLQHLTRIPPFSVLTRILPFPVLTWILPSRYLPGSHLSGTRSNLYFFGTRPDSTISQYSLGPFSGTRPDPTFPVLTRISTFPALAQNFLWYSPGFHLSSVFAKIFTFPALTRIPHFFSVCPDFHLSGTHPDSTFLGTLPDPTFSILARIPPFRYSPRPFPVLARIPPFRHSPRFFYLWYLPKFHISGTHSDSTLSRNSLGPFSGTRQDFTLPALALILPFSVLAQIPHFRHSPGFYPFRYSHGFQISSTCLDFTLFGTCPDSTFPTLTRILPCPSTHPDPSSILARISHFLHSPGFYPFSILTQTLLRY